MGFPSRSAAVLDAVLARMEKVGLTAAGTRAELYPRMTDSGRRLGRPADVVAGVFDILTAIGGSRYHGPTWRKGPVGLETILSALPISDRARKKLAQELALQANSEADTEVAFINARAVAKLTNVHFDAERTEDELARAVGGRLARLAMTALEDRSHLESWDTEVRPPLPRGERVAEDAIREHRHLISGTIDKEQLARDWGGEFENLTPVQARELVGKRLAMPIFARWLSRDGEPVEFNYFDPMYKPSHDETAEMEAVAAELNSLMGNR